MFKDLNVKGLFSLRNNFFILYFSKCGNVSEVDFWRNISLLLVSFEGLSGIDLMKWWCF